MLGLDFMSRGTQIGMARVQWLAILSGKGVDVHIAKLMFVLALYPLLKSNALESLDYN